MNQLCVNDNKIGFSVYDQALYHEQLRLSRGKLKTKRFKLLSKTHEGVSGRYMVEI